MNAPALFLRVLALFWIGSSGLYLRGTIRLQEIPCATRLRSPIAKPRILDFTPII